MAQGKLFILNKKYFSGPYFPGLSFQHHWARCRYGWNFFCHLLLLVGQATILLFILTLEAVGCEHSFLFLSFIQPTGQPANQPQVGTSGWNLRFQPQVPTSGSNLRFQPQVGTSGFNLRFQPQVPTSGSDLECFGSIENKACCIMCRLR